MSIPRCEVPGVFPRWRFPEVAFSRGGKSMLPRNLGPDGAFAKKNLRIESGVEIKKVTPTENVRAKDLPKHLQKHAGKPGKVLVEFDGMAPEVFDSVVVSHGPDSRQRGGVADVTKKLKFELDEVDNQLAALQRQQAETSELSEPRSGMARFKTRAGLLAHTQANRLKEHASKFGKKLPKYSNKINQSLNATVKTVSAANRNEH